MQLRVKSALKALIDIGYELSDFQEPEDGEEIAFVSMSRDGDPDICLILPRDKLEDFYEEAKKYHDFS